jgi:predicted permease
LISLVQLFAKNILPILIVSSIGFILQRIFTLNPRTISQIVFNAFTPFLIFSLLASTEIQAQDLGLMVALVILVIACTGILAWILAKSLHLHAGLTSAFILTAVFMNSGNFGLSLNFLAFGNDALAWASIFFVSNSIMIYSLGVYIATVGRIKPIQALRGLLKVPAIYAIPLGFIVRAYQIEIPDSIWRSIDLLSSAAIPCMLIILGMQIANAGLPKRIDLLFLSAVLRLVVSPAIAFFLTSLMGITGPAFQASVSEAATPTAVMTSIISLEYDVEPEYVAGAILFTTLLSPITLTPLLSLLGA